MVSFDSFEHPEYRCSGAAERTWGGPDVHFFTALGLGAAGSDEANRRVGALLLGPAVVARVMEHREMERMARDEEAMQDMVNVLL